MLKEERKRQNVFKRGREREERKRHGHREERKRHGHREGREEETWKWRGERRLRKREKIFKENQGERAKFFK